MNQATDRLTNKPAKQAMKQKPAPTAQFHQFHAIQYIANNC